MDAILRSVRELPGVTAAFVFDGAGALSAFDGHSIYDAELVTQVSQSLVKALESVQLQMPDWDAITAQFQDGLLSLRNLGAAADGQPHVLAVVADAQLSTPFAAVAMRVAVQKLKKVLGGAASGASSPSLPRAPGATSSSPALARTPPAGSRPPPGRPISNPSQPTIASSGMTWSRLSGSSGSSGIEVADAASSAFLTRCSKELARHVGPMSKIYVKEAVRRVSPSAPFALSLARPLVEDLANQIEDLEDRTRFRKALEKI